MSVFKTKNFLFIEEKNFRIDNKEKFIDLISIAEELKEPELCVNNIKKALEIFINDFAENILGEKDFSNKNLDLIQKIRYLEENPQLNNKKSKQFINVAHEIRTIRNYAKHGHNEKFPYKINKNIVVVQLQNLWAIIKYLRDDIDSKYDFNEKLYELDLKDISAISDKVRNNELFRLRDLKIDDDSIKNWLSISNSKIFIPIYQRKYEWNEENIKVLLEDIIKRTEDNEEHYFGTIAQKKVVSNNLEIHPHYIKIIDGQQRLTTSLLIVCAIRDIFKENGWETDLNWYQELLDTKNDLSKYITNPGGTSDNNRIFENILKGQLNEGNSDKENQFKQNYLFVKKELKSRFQNEKGKYINFINVFLNNFRVGTVNFDDEKFSNKREMEIFENLNSKGMELSIVDLIKNHLINYCKDDLLNSKDNEDKIAIEYNRIIKSIDINSNNLEEFYLMLSEIVSNKEIPKNRREKFSIIKDSIDTFFERKNIMNISKISDFEKMMCILKNHLNLFVLCSDKNISNSFIEYLGCKNIVSIIRKDKKLKLFFYPLLTIYECLNKIYNSNHFDFNLSSQEIKLKPKEKKAIQNLFYEVVKYIIRTTIITKQGNSSIKQYLRNAFSEIYNNMYKFDSIEKLCEEAIDKIQLINRKHYPHDKFETELKNNSNTTGILELFMLIELEMNKAIYNDSEKIEREKISIEHILPQDCNIWLDNQKDQESKNQFNIFAKDYKEKIGNYLLLTVSSNSKIKNKLFIEKKKEIYSSLVSPIYKNDNDDIDVSRKNEWTFEMINKRTNAIINYVLNNLITE